MTVGMLYDVFYPDRTMDREVSDRYLDALARDKSNTGALAVCVNGERVKLRLTGGLWVEESILRREKRREKQ